MKLTTHLHLEPRLKVVEASAAPPNMPSWHAERAFNFYRQKYSKSGTLAASLFPCWSLNIDTNMPIIAVFTGDQIHLSYNPNFGPFSLEYTVYSLYSLSYDRSIASSKASSP
jgi:hypothetical protein